MNITDDYLTAADLIRRLNSLQKESNDANCRTYAESLLLQYIDDNKVTQAFCNLIMKLGVTNG